MAIDWVERLKTAQEDAFNRSSRLAIGAKKSLCLDGDEIPYEYLPLAFECLATKRITYNRNGSVRRTHLSIDIGKDRFAMHRFANGDYEFTFRNLLHCASGPSKKIGSTLEFYIDGVLHNEAGPAIIDGERKSYFLDGKHVRETEFVERSPKASHSWGTRGLASFTTSKLGDTAVVRGMDGTVAILSATNDPPNQDDLLLDLIGTRIPGYKVVGYDNIGPQIAPIYEYLNSDRGKWETDTHLESTKIHYSRPDGSKAILSYSKNSHNLKFKIRLPNGHHYEAVADFTFDTLSGAAPHFPDIRVQRDPDGRLHNIHGPALTIAHGDFRSEHFFVHGNQLSREEHDKYDAMLNRVIFTNEFGDYHRVDGPAIIDLPPHGLATKYWFEDGRKVDRDSDYSSESEQLINSSGTAMPTYTDLNAKQEQRQNKFEEALKRVASRSNEKKVRLNSAGEMMDTKTVKHGDAPASTSDSRVRQVASGAKLGLQKAALKVGSQKVAEKIVEAASPTDNVVVQRIVQLMLLLGTAELAERLPDGAASKVGLTEERREGYGGLARYVAGETLGRDAVDIVSFVAPMLLDKLQGISAEEISELTSDAEEVERIEAQAASAVK